MNISQYPEVVYLAVYVAISDNRVYDSEWECLESYIKNNSYSEDVREESIKIIKNLPDKIPFDDVIGKIADASEEIRMEAMSLTLKIAFMDSSLSESEEVILGRINRRFVIDSRKYASMLNEVRLETQKEKNLQGQLELLKKRYSNSLFDSAEYKDIIRNIQKIAEIDVKIATEKTDSAIKSLQAAPELVSNQMRKVLKYEARFADDSEGKAIDDFSNNLQTTLVKLMDNSKAELALLKGKQISSANRYTISFMGKTKAGKSTLHSVILGGLNNDFIGRGSERTTRYNYIYDYSGIRIIDTPGIGAPGGMEDTEIAEDVADESDLICYVVTSDSIQETEFNFLKKLKDQNKPVIILLNKKENFARSSKKKEAFLENPLLWYETDGEDSIKGHIDRINTYVTMNHDYHNFMIVPVQLLAAKLSLSEEDEEKRKLYRKGSRIDIFLETVKYMIQRYGLLQRSSTIYNAAVHHLMIQNEVINNQVAELLSIQKMIAENRTRVVNSLNDIQKVTKNHLIEHINTLYDSFIENEVHTFAISKYNLPKKQLNTEWENLFAESKFVNSVQEKCDYEMELYLQKIEDMLTEVEEDFSFTFEKNSLSNVKRKLVFDITGTIDIVNSVHVLAGAIIGIFFPPVLIIAGTIGAVIGLVNNLLLRNVVKSKKEQITEAENALFKSLSENINEMREKNIDSTIKTFEDSHEKIKKKIVHYYDSIFDSLAIVRERLDDLSKDQTVLIEELNTDFAIRIFNYATGKIIDELRIPSKTFNVVRDFGKYIKISTDTGVNFVNDLESISGVLQEQIQIGEV